MKHLFHCIALKNNLMTIDKINKVKIKPEMFTCKHSTRNNLILKNV